MEKDVLPLKTSNGRRSNRRKTVTSIASSIFVDLTERSPWLCRTYSTVLVKYYAWFLLIGVVICVSLTVSALYFRKLPDFSDPTKGFIPRGKNTLTSRLFVLEKIRNEIFRQIETLRNLKNRNSGPTDSLPINDASNEFDDEEFESERDFEANLTVNALLVDFRNAPNECFMRKGAQGKCVTNKKIYKMIDNRSDLMVLPREVEEKVVRRNGRMCTSIDLNRHYEVYFQSSNDSSRNLLNIDNLQSLCRKQEELLKTFELEGTCFFTLPEIVSIFAEKSNCRDLVEQDVQTFIDRMNRCRKLHEAEAIRLVGLNKNSHKTLELFQYDSCFRHNLTFLSLEFILDKNFFDKNETHLTAMWFLKPDPPVRLANGKEKHNTESAIDVFTEKFYGKTKFDDSSTKVAALNFLDIRIPTAMRQIEADMGLVILAIVLIVAVTIIYLRSITVAIMTNICVIFSFGCAYFTYRILFDIDLFPYINLMATFILIGISCDNVFVIFDAWYSEKLDFYKEKLLRNEPVTFYGKLTERQESHLQRDKEKATEIIREQLAARKSACNEILNNEKFEETRDAFDLIENTDLVRMMEVDQDKMIQMMAGVLRHAAASVFVTSFTTSAAFFTNMISNIAYVQLFGLFMGLCILFNFIMNVTMITSFVIVYEKYFERWAANSCLFRRIPSIFDRILNFLTRLNHSIFAVYILRAINKLRLVLICLFFTLGLVGLYIVFIDPKLSPPSSRRYQFFRYSHPFERFEYGMRDQFYSYIKEDKENITNPPLIFVFGAEETDLVDSFNPDRSPTTENGELFLYNKKIDFYDPKVLLWFDDFLRNLNRSDLFVGVRETYSQWVTIGQLLKAYSDPSTNFFSQKEKSDQFFVPPTRNATLIAMNRLFQFFSESNDMASSPSSPQSVNKYRIGFSIDVFTKKIKAIFFIVKMNVNFDNFITQDEYFKKLENYFKTRLEQLKLSEGDDLQVYDQVKHGWFVSPQFLFYDLMREVIRGTHISLICSLFFAFIVLMLTSGNLLITAYAMITIIFIIADTVGIFVLWGWELSVLQTIIIIMSVGLSVDFTVHYGVAYIKADWQRNQTGLHRSRSSSRSVEMNSGTVTIDDLDKETNDNTKNKPTRVSFFKRLRDRHRKGDFQRKSRVKSSLSRVGSAVFIASLTSFLAGISMAPSELTSFSQMGIFLMLIMFVSWLYATWFFLPLLLFLGPIDKFARIPLGKLCHCSNQSSDKEKSTRRIDNDEEEEVKKKLNEPQATTS